MNLKIKILVVLRYSHRLYKVQRSVKDGIFCSIFEQVKDSFFLCVNLINNQTVIHLYSCHVKDGMMNLKDFTTNKVYCLILAEVFARDIFMSK